MSDRYWISVHFTKNDFVDTRDVCASIVTILSMRDLREKNKKKRATIIALLNDSTFCDGTFSSSAVRTIIILSPGQLWYARRSKSGGRGVPETVTRLKAFVCSNGRKTTRAIQRTGVQAYSCCVFRDPAEFFPKPPPPTKSFFPRRRPVSSSRLPIQAHTLCSL